MDKLKITRFKDLTTLVAEKDDLRRKNDEWLKRQETLRSFYNGKPIMTEAEADEENIDEITNHLIGYSNMQVTETRLYSLWSTSNKFIDVNVLDEDMDVAEREKTSSHINKALNRAIYRSTRFGAFCRSVAGEIVMAGRAACIHKQDADWCPSVAPKIYLPDTVGTDASELTYAFIPKEMTHAQLQQLLDEDDGEDNDDDRLENEVEVNREVVEQLMATIDSQLQMTGSQLNEGSENEHHKATNTDEVEQNNKTTVNLWGYYETRYDEDLDSTVVDLLIFTDEFREKSKEGNKKGGGDHNQTYKQVAYYPAFYESPSQWMHLIVIDASIGGDKRFATAKGIAEITYNSDVDSEELLNRIYEGEKMRAIPRFREGPNVSEEKLLGWSPHDSTLVPEGVEEFRFSGNTGGLNNPLALFQQNSARQSSAGYSNSGRDGELRTQAVERQGNNQSTQISRTADLYKSMEIIANEMVRRFFVGEIEGGSPGYQEIMWFRKQMEKRNIDLERLAEMEFGVYEHIEVKVVKSSTSGEIDHDLVVSEKLMQNLQHLPAAVRPMIVNKFIAIITGDQDFADSLQDLMPKIVSAQRVTAESEFEQIARDASVGVDTPTGEDDVHIEHILAHNKHLQVIINKSLMRPWTREDAAHFAGIQVHQTKHFEQALSDSASRADAEIQLRQFQELVQEGDKLLDDVSRKEMEEEGLSDKEIDRNLKIAEQKRKQQETDIKQMMAESTAANRDQRRNDVRRQSDQRFLIEQERLNRES